MISQTKMMWTYLVCTFIGSVSGQIIRYGACPNVTVKQDFDVTKFVGKWYEAQRYFTIFELGGKCSTATYTAKDNTTISVLNKQIMSITGIPSSIKGYATQNTDEKAKLAVVFPSMPFKIGAPYWVLDTDYDSYAVIWSCSRITLFSVRFAWILTREQLPDETVMKKAHEVFDNNEIDKSRLQVTDQNNCPKDN